MRNKKAFSLVEILIAIGVLTVGILSVFALIPLGTRLSKATENQTVAINLAQGLIDEKINQGYDQLPPNDTGKIKYTTDQNSSFYKFNQQSIIEFVDSNLVHSDIDTGLKKITITIYWQDSSQEKNYSIITLVAKK